MCLILFGWQAHPDYPLVVAANRDEYHQRASAGADFWAELPSVLAGRDLEAQGSWMGVSRHGRFAAVTNYRESSFQGTLPQAPRSRGTLVSDFLAGTVSAATYAGAVATEADHFRGFNLLAYDGAGLHYFSNRGDGPRAVLPGVYGLSNHLLDTAWPKVRRGRDAFKVLLESAPGVEALMGLLADAQAAPADQLPDTGIGIERETLLSPMRIVSDTYGTRCSTVLVMHASGRVQYAERTWTPAGAAGQTRRYDFALA